MLKIVNLSCLQGIHKRMQLFTQFTCILQEHDLFVQRTVAYITPCYSPAESAAEAEAVKFELAVNYTKLIFPTPEKLILHKIWWKALVLRAALNLGNRRRMLCSIRQIYNWIMKRNSWELFEVLAWLQPNSPSRIYFSHVTLDIVLAWTE